MSCITWLIPSRTGIFTVDSFHAGSSQALNAAHRTNKIAPVAQTRRKSYCNNQLPSNAPTTAPALSCIIRIEKKRPRFSGRISLTTSAERGGSNSVPPSPERKQENHNSHGSWAMPMVANPAARISMPVTIIGFAPKRSAIAPPKIPNPCWIN